MGRIPYFKTCGDIGEQLLNRGLATLRYLLSAVKSNKDIFFAISSSMVFAIADMLIYHCGSIFHPVLVALGLSSGMTLSSFLFLIVQRPSYPSHEGLKLLSCLSLHAFLSVFCSFCIILSNIYANPGDAIAVGYSSAMFTVVLSAVVLRESFRVTDFVFATLSFSGVVLITRPEFLFHNHELSEHENGGTYAIGIMAALCASVTEAFILIVYSVISSYDVHPFYIVAPTGLLGVAVITPLSFMFAGLWTVGVSYIHYLKLPMIGIIWSLGILLSFLAVKGGRPTRVAILMPSQTIFVYIGQYFLFSVHVHWLAYIGTACIVVASIGIGTINDTKPKEEGSHEEDEEVSSLLK